MSEAFGRASGYVADVEHPTFDRHPRLAPVVRFSRSATQANPGMLAGGATDTVLAGSVTATQRSPTFAFQIVG